MQRISDDRHYCHNERVLLAIEPALKWVQQTSEDEVDFDSVAMRQEIFEQ